MSVDYESLKKLETVSPATAAAAPKDGGRLVVLVKLRDGAAEPSYLSPRARMGERMFSAEIAASDLARMESDPSIESVAVSRRLPLV
jgi:hypothetical protein